MKLVQYKEIFPNSEKLESALEEKYPGEIFEDNNWFTKSVAKVFKIIHTIFLAKTASKYFIWNYEKEDFQDLLNGFFILTLWQELMSFYTKQLVFVNGDLKDLADWKNRGNSSKALAMGASNKNSNATVAGYKWDDKLDAASTKFVNDKDINVTNRINDIKNMLASSLTLRFIDLFFEFEKFFIDKNWADKKWRLC